MLCPEMSMESGDLRAASERLAELVRHIRKRILGLSQEAFVAVIEPESERLSLSSLRRIEQAASTSYWSATLRTLDRTVRAHGVSDWPGAETVMGQAAGAVVTMAMVDARIEERLGQVERDEADELADWSGRLGREDRALLVALARWLALRAS